MEYSPLRGRPGRLGGTSVPAAMVKRRLHSRSSSDARRARNQIGFDSEASIFVDGNQPIHYSLEFPSQRPTSAGMETAPMVSDGRPLHLLAARGPPAGI